MDLGLRDKRALVLGSSRGLGRGIAAALAAEGAAVGISGRNAEGLETVAADIASTHGVRVESYPVDLMDGDAVAAMAERVDAEFGGLDILVANGGGPGLGDITEVTADSWKIQFQGMALSQMALITRFLPGMRERGWGRILILSTSGIVQPIPGLGFSSAVRSVLMNWAKTLAGDVAADGVTVNTLVPGRIQTERVDQIDRGDAKRRGLTQDEVASASQASIPARRYGTVEEYGAVAAFLASEQASYVTGSLIRVDGGAIRAI